MAWAEYGTPAELPNIHHRKQYDAEADLPPDYRVTCIFVDKRYRRRGLAETARLGAVDLISQAGGGVVEGYPHVPGEKKMSCSFLYNGTRAMYERCGSTSCGPKDKEHRHAAHRRPGRLTAVRPRGRPVSDSRALRPRLVEDPRRPPGQGSLPYAASACRGGQPALGVA